MIGKVWDEVFHIGATFKLLLARLPRREEVRSVAREAAAYGVMPAKVLEYERLYDPDSGQWLERRDGQTRAASVELEVGRLWYALVMLLRPARVLETGTYRGYSTCCIAAALRALGGERRVTTIDPLPIGHLWEGTELEKQIEWIGKRSDRLSGELDGREFDLLVLDSDHAYDTIITELMLFEPRLKTGGCILLHDSLFFDGVGAAVAQLARNPRFEVVTLDSPRAPNPGRVRSPGVTVVRKKADGVPKIEFEERWRGVNVGDDREMPLLRK